MTGGRTALIAGHGVLPRLVADALDAPVVRHLDGFAPDGLVSEPFRIETLGTLLADLPARGVTRVCFAGRIARPALDPARLDAATAPLVPRLVAAMQAGDDGALTAVIALFEEAGMDVVAPQDIAPALLDLPATGAPTPEDRRDIARAAEVHAALAPVDVGQGCVVARGQVLAIEALPGTDWMLRSLTAFERPPGGVFFKAAKAGQDRRIDLPGLGPETVRAVAAAGLSGLAVEAGGILVIDRDAVAAALTETGLWLHPWTR